MCGIAGFWARRGFDGDTTAVLAGMTAALRHRGPDDEGCWCDAEMGIAFGHRRLSIVDLSPEGHQPMASADGRYVVAYNGEVYNFLDLRADLESGGTRFRGHSDTEVMLAAMQQRGIEAAVRALVGMFAMAIFDRSERALYLVRDRIGEKPLYYGWRGETLLFGSELKALRTHPAWRGEVDREALTLFLRYGYIPAPRSIYQGIQKVSPGTILRFPQGSRAEPELTTYWSAREAAETGMREHAEESEVELLAELETRLGEAVRREMIADVPLGAFLSGGIDSSLIVSLMQASSSRPVRTFTIGFEEQEYNEAPHAKAVARHLGTDHTELFVRPAEALAVVPRLPTLYDEPFADSSQVPTFLVCELARQHVTVSLSGDGGDELFGGYDRYFLGLRAWSVIGLIPQFLRRAVGRGVRALPPQRWDSVLRGVGLARAAGAGRRVTGDRLHKLAGILSAETWELLYRDFVSQWRDAPSVVVEGGEPATAFTDARPWSPAPDPLSRMTFLDQVTYLPDDILVKVDRASMGVSLETRAPFLDHRMVEFAWRVPSRWKVRQGRGKWLLRRLLDRYVPRELIERPKMGFGLPIDHWLRGPLKEWGAELLDESRLRREGFLDPQSIVQKWQEHQDGSRNWHYLLWVVLMFQAWLEAQTA